jgi:hypothetical protein
MVHTDRMAKSKTSGTMMILQNEPLPGGMRKVRYRHEMVDAHAGQTEAQAAQREYDADFRARGLGVEKSEWRLREDIMHEAAGIQSQSLEAMKKNIRETMPGPQAEAVIEQMTKFWLERLPDTSVRKAQQRARRVSGADRDMLAVFASYAQGAAYFQAQMRFGHRIAKTLGSDAQDDERTLLDAKAYHQAADLRAVVEHLKRLDANTETASAISTRGKRSWFGEIWQKMPQWAGAYLLTGFGTMLTNAAQPVMTGLPHLSARHGVATATKALASAASSIVIPQAWGAGKEVIRAGMKFPKSAISIAKGGEGLSSKTSTPFYREITANLTDPKEKALIERLAEMKKIDYGLVADLQTAAKKSGKFWTAVDYLSELAFIMPQAVETGNRTVVALASYRANRITNPSWTEEQLLAQAAVDLDETQFNYSQANKPQIFQMDWARQLATFKTYPQAMVYTILHNAFKSFDRSVDSKERAVAAKTLAGLAITTTAASGLLGIAMFEPIYWATVTMLHLFTDDDDPEQAMRRLMADWPPLLSSMMIRGVPYGLGIADTGRMGLPQLAPSTEIKRALLDNGADQRALFTILGESLAGPLGGVSSDVAAAAGHLADGNKLKAAAAMLPKGFAINDIARMLEYMNNGVKNTAGYQSLSPEQITTWGVIVRGLGFEPPIVADLKTKQRAYHRREAEAVAGNHAVQPRQPTAGDQALDAGQLDQGAGQGAGVHGPDRRERATAGATGAGAGYSQRVLRWPRARTRVRTRAASSSSCSPKARRAAR